MAQSFVIIEVWLKNGQKIADWQQDKARNQTLPLYFEFFKGTGDLTLAFALRLTVETVNTFGSYGATFRRYAVDLSRRDGGVSRPARG